MTALDDIRRASERLRRLPEARWSVPPQPPLGARPPGATGIESGEPLERQVRDAIARLMHADARARNVHPFTPEVGVFALADVLYALARSAHASDDAAALRAVEAVAGAAREW